jgi:SAM-dependent methyltransferase
VSPDPNEYWDSVAGRWHEEQPQQLWRSYCDTLNGRLIRRFLADRKVERALKTDLFDEATSVTGLIPFLSEPARSVVGFDLSFLTTHLARAKHPALQACSSDARSLPFAEASFDIVLSNSTLDHFAEADDIDIAVREIVRVLRPGGRLLMTLDNLANPVIALRRALPHRLLNRLGLVPYYTGATCGPKRLRTLLQEAGLEPLHVGAMMHCPRVPAVMVANLIDRLGRPGRGSRLESFLLKWEILEKLPTRYLSGYFIAVLAERPSG